jgi:2-keto-4-pentenoate hydratase/2-oxohepta-3-ene-1,7-dioic acid hydratase in catechol pathway
MQLTVNGELRQRGNTSQFIFDIATLIAYISCHFPLFPGDIIATGTPEGVAAVHDGDAIELSASGLGTLRNRIRMV